MPTGPSAAPTSPAIPPPIPAAAVAPSPAAPVVEVVTTLGASVVAVDHLRHQPARAPRARLMLGLGAALLAGSAITFAAGVRSAHRDTVARERWIAEGRPAWAFRPTSHGAASDVLALGGALAGVGLIASGLLSRRERTRTSLKVGQNDGVDVPLADAPPELSLVTSDGHGGFVAHLAGLTGDVRQGTRVTPIAALTAAGQVTVPITLATQVRAQVGRTTFHLKGMEAPAASAAPTALSFERHGLAFLAASAVVHFGLLALLRTVPPDASTAAIDSDVVEPIQVSAAAMGREDDIPPPPEDGDGDTSGANGASSPQVAMALEDGTLGTDQPNPNPARLRVKDRGEAEQLARTQAIEMAREAGILGAVSSPVAVYAGGSIASGFDDLDITGGLFDGGGTGAPVGSFGWGVKGVGQGCGRTDGKPCEGIKAGPFATIGWQGDSERPTLKDRPGTDGSGKHKPVAPPVKAGQPECVGETCLDRDLIRRYVARNLEKITYCYEKELLARPELEGTVTALFTLNGNGAVIDSKASGVDPNVSSCIALVMSNIQFPKVGPPGIYPIKYPFKLRPSGR